MFCLLVRDRKLLVPPFGGCIRVCQQRSRGRPNQCQRRFEFMSHGVDQRCSELFTLTCGLNLLRQLLCLRSLKANGDQIRKALQYWLAHCDSAQGHAGERLRTTTDSDDYIASLISWRVSNHGRCTPKRVGNALRSLNPDTVKIPRMPLI